MNQKLISTADEYLSHGISITLTDDRKASIGPWRDYQSRFITHDELHDRVRHAHGIAIICGKVSKGIEVIDIDLKYDLTGNLFDRLKTKLGDIFDKLTISKTISGGYHLYYRCPVIEGNQKLARRPTTEEELAKNPHQKVLVLIETRGESGYVIAPPSSGYQWIQGDHTTIPIILESEREYILETCRSFNQYLEEKQTEHEPTPDYGVSPIDDFNERGDVIQLLQKHGWKKLHNREGKTFFRRPGKDDGQSGDYWHDKRWFSVFTTSTQFEPNTAYNPSAVFCVLEAQNNWKECVKLLAKQGYGKDNKAFNRDKTQIKFAIKLIHDGHPDDYIISRLYHERQIPHKEGAVLLDKAHKSIAQGDDFWEEDAKGRLIVNKDRIIKFLESRGYRLMPLDKYGNTIMIVQIQDNIIEEVTIEKVKKECYHYAQERNARAAEWLVDKHNLFTDSFLQFLKKERLDILRDTPTESFFPFRNCIVKVTKDGTECLEYGKVDKLIWRSAIINRDIHLQSMVDDDNDLTINEYTDYFAQFILLVCDRDENRFKSFMSTIGYLLHGYKDPSRPYAVCLAEETDDDSKGGGTGKGIFITAISKMIKLEQFDGKNYKHEKSFQWQRVTEDTRIIAIQDLRKGVDFEGFYTVITDTMIIERKNQKEIELPFEKSPKILFSTNYMISDLANHARRRLLVLPFSNYFSPDHTPLDEFKVMLFEGGWDNEHWNNFFNFMFYCIQYYFKNGLMMLEKTEGMKLKAISNAFTPEFRAWVEEKLDKSGNWVSKKQLYEEFLAFSDYQQKDYSMRRFGTALKQSSTILGLDYQEKNMGNNGGRMVNITSATQIATLNQLNFPVATQ